MPTYYEFFAGGGMASVGLGGDWRCLFANDIDAKKAATFRANHPAVPFVESDIAKIGASQLPSYAELIWASSPCQDFSLAGNGKGLAGARSGTFNSFWKLMQELVYENRAPKIIAFENVVGLLSSNNGADFEAVCQSFHDEGYWFAPIVVDAKLFLPQSRPRLFVLGVRSDLDLSGLFCDGPDTFWHGSRMRRAFDRLPKALRSSWRWFVPSRPVLRNEGLSTIIEDDPVSVNWNSPEKTAHILSLMDDNHRKKVDKRRELDGQFVGAVYRRMRPDGAGGKVQRAEVRFDGLAGCLRTPAGGSSRQTLMFVQGAETRTRLVSPREAARLMGLPEQYELPARYNDAYHLLGDGVAVPVVTMLKEQLFNQIISTNLSTKAA